MYTLTSQGGKTSYGLKHYIVSTYREIESDLPVDLLMGSTAYCLEDQSLYMRNSEDGSDLSKNLWTKVYLNSSGGSGSGGDDTYVIYDGGIEAPKY